MRRIFRAFFAGILALLPIGLTIYVLYLLIEFIVEYLGSGSDVGKLLIGLGQSVGLQVDDRLLHWGIGVVIVFLSITLFGFIVGSRIGPWILGLFERPLRSIPIMGSIFDVVKRLTSVMDASGNDDLQNMSPVWCFFGGDKDGAAVFGLMPTKEKVSLGEKEYLGVLLPTAPVPFGGALIYVPSDWVEPVDGAVDHLMSVYVSMGVQPPNGIKPAAVALPSTEPKP